MRCKFEVIDFSEIREFVAERLETFSSPVDSFLEDHLLASIHYNITCENIKIGYVSVHKGHLLTSVYINDSFSRHSQLIFRQIKQLESVCNAFIPTCDEFFLSLALDEFKMIDKQANFFKESPDLSYSQNLASFSCRLASDDDYEMIKEKSGKFFDNIQNHLDLKELWISYDNNSCVGFGLIIPSKILKNAASIGMFTIPDKRCKGYGTETIKFLVSECRRRKIRAVAGCGYTNHNSKKTLESAGMLCHTRLLKIHF